MRVQQEGRRRYPRDRCGGPWFPLAPKHAHPPAACLAGAHPPPHPPLRSLPLSPAGVPFSTFDILTDEAIRQGLKTYSDWPTYPQLYVGRELLGGCDIVMEMKEKGELKQALQPAEPMAA